MKTIKEIVEYIKKNSIGSMSKSEFERILERKAKDTDMSELVKLLNET